VGGGHEALNPATVMGVTLSKPIPLVRARHRLRRFLSACVAVVTLHALPIVAQSPAHAVASFAAVTLPAGADAPLIDGRVTDGVWQRAPPMTEFTQQDPQEGQPATERTEVRLLFTATHLYVGLICFDRNPSAIIVSQSRRDASLNETDSVILVFDTFNDNQNAFVFGTNPLGIEYDGQVAREGQTSGVTFGGNTLAASAASGTQRGAISAFNPNWDGDWTVKAQVTDRGWEAEMAIPLKTLRYAAGTNRTWGFNVLRNIRHKNEQVYLSPIARGFDIYRVSQAAKITGLDLVARRDVKLIPYELGSINKDFTRTSDRVDRRASVGADFKWGVRPSLTFDATVNTDFAQVEADEEQLNLTRFDLFFPEKRPFFLENASTFQFGQPQTIDLFFSRRIGLSASGLPIDIRGGSRLSGKLSTGWNIGVLNIQTDHAEDATDTRVAPATNFSVMRAQKEVGRSTIGGIFVGRYATDDNLAGLNKWNRAYGVDADLQVSRSQRVSTFVARTDTSGPTGSDYAARGYYNFTNNLWQIAGGVSQVGDRFNPEAGFLPRRGFRRPELRIAYQYQPKSAPWIRRISPHTSAYVFYGLDGTLQSSFLHVHAFEIQPAHGGRFGWFMDRNQDRPLKSFTVYERDGRHVAIAPGLYTWSQHGFEYFHNPSARVASNVRVRVGRYYDGDFNSIEVTSDYRFSARTTASLGWTRQHASLPAGDFVTYLLPIKGSFAFTPLASLSALLQYNGQTAQFSSNIRLALLTRSGTGLFIVYNDRRDRTDYTSLDTLSRSFVIKYTRLFEF
jgi:hypothetical protein